MYIRLMSRSRQTSAMLRVPSALTFLHNSIFCSAASTAVYAAQWITASGPCFRNYAAACVFIRDIHLLHVHADTLNPAFCQFVHHIISQLAFTPVTKTFIALSCYNLSPYILSKYELYSPLIICFPPVLVLQIPLNCLFDSRIKIILRLPSDFRLYFSRINGIAQIMARPVP